MNGSALHPSRRLRHALRCVLPLCLALPALAVRGETVVEASPPRGATITIHDSGFAQVAELRSANLRSGRNEVVLRSLPARLDPASVSLMPVAGRQSLEVLQQRFLFDLADPALLLQRYLGLPVEVVSAAGRFEGVLAGLRGPDGSGALALRRPDGAAVLYLDETALTQVVFPGAATRAFLEPTLVWQLETPEEATQQLRLSYLVEGLRWEASYEMQIAPADREAWLSVRVGIENRSGGAFERARLRLVATERGMAPPAMPRPDRLARPLAAADTALRAGGPLRYRYRGDEPVFERMAAGTAPAHTYEIEQSVDLAQQETLYLQYARVENLPVTRFHVYDGALFDRFRTPRRNDWNYGTESHQRVETHVEFQNIQSYGLGMALPPGRFRLYERHANGAVDLLGVDRIPAITPEAFGHVVLGPARGLSGERERLSYSEVRALQEYDETFSIRLRNETEEAVEIRVVEHLYRWHDYEIIRADTDFAVTGPRTIEFRPTIPPGGTRQVGYTVRYRWQ